MFTHQETFDMVVQGLASQSWERSDRGSIPCYYRGLEGRKCAVGWLIPDEAYTDDMEFRSVRDHDMQLLLREHDLDLLLELLNLHDDWRDPRPMWQRFYAYAVDHGLDESKCEPLVTL